jgi:DUF1680 family protein
MKSQIAPIHNKIKTASTFLKIAVLCLFLLSQSTWGQNIQKIKAFDLDQVQLGASDFKKAREIDLKYIMEMEPDRLLAPFLREAGLSPKAESYGNWENTGLDGHIGGHYITALSLMYASTGNTAVKERLDYMLNELKRCQDAHGNGYIGGVPQGSPIWQEIAKGNIKAGSFSLNDKWVPLYNIHKTYAGLYDAFVHTGSDLAKEMLVKFTDWMLQVTANLSEEDMQRMLSSEHGGLNEVFAEVARITGEDKYLQLAKRFSHQTLLLPLIDGQDKLNGMHANTQIPKVIGFEAIAALTGDQPHHKAAQYFWDNVVNKRSVAIGGNSVREHFHPASDFSSMLSSVQGPETCNTYNMLKLSKRLFEAEGLEKYINYYEQGLYNHILSSQHPEKGGFVYFTPMRSGHYRVYSQPQTSFWCCVGSGIENHAKYNELIYAYTNEELFINLFIPSTVEWTEKAFSVVQETRFPEEETTSFLIKTKKAQTLNIQMRYPSWIGANEMQIEVNGKPFPFSILPGSYIPIRRKWKNGDKIVVKLPMQIHTEGLPDGSNVEALKYGPIVLAAITGKEDLKGLFADDSRGGHIAEGDQISLDEMPVFLTETPQNIAAAVQKNKEKPMTFSAPELLYPEKYKNLEFIPFYKLHEARYALYFPIENAQSWEEKQQLLREREAAAKRLETSTIDFVAPGEQQPESDHFVASERSSIGVHRNRHWRDAEGWFSYKLQNEEGKAQKLRITYFGADANRNFSISINNIIIATEQFEGKKGPEFFDVDYALPKEILAQGHTEMTVKFEALSNARTAGIYGVRLMKGDAETN